MTRKEARKELKKYLSIGYNQDKLARTDTDVALLIAIKALDELIDLEKKLGYDDMEIDIPKSNYYNLWGKKMTSREKEIKAQIDEYVTNEYDDLYLDFDDYVVIADMLNRLAKMELILKNKLDKWGVVMYNRRKDMTKKAFKELQKQNRATNGFNTGTRTMKSDKHPSRARRKEMEREEEDET